MKAELLKAVGVDVEEGIKRFSGREDLYCKFLYRFTEDENFLKCKEAMETGDLESAFTHAHALKGLTGNLSMNRFYKHLYNVVEALRAKDEDLAKQLFDNLVEEYDTLIKAVEASKE